MFRASLLRCHGASDRRWASQASPCRANQPRRKQTRCDTVQTQTEHAVSLYFRTSRRAVTIPESAWPPASYPPLIAVRQAPILPRTVLTPPPHIDIVYQRLLKQHRGHLSRHRQLGTRNRARQRTRTSRMAGRRPPPRRASRAVGPSSLALALRSGRPAARPAHGRRRRPYQLRDGPRQLVPSPGGSRDVPRDLEVQRGVVRRRRLPRDLAGARGRQQKLRAVVTGTYGKYAVDARHEQVRVQAVRRELVLLGQIQMLRRARDRVHQSEVRRLDGRAS